jgi:hypothetical protein
LISKLTSRKIEVKNVKNILFVFLSLLLIFGCVGPISGDVNETTPVKNETKQPEPTTNVTPPANVTPPVNVTENETPPMNETPSQPTYTQTNLTVDELLSKKLGEIFHEGQYKVRTIQWVSNQLEVDPQAIMINPTMHILFDNKSEDNLAGFGFKTYEKNGSIEFAEGYAIVMTKSTILDSSMVGTFDIDFLVPGFETKLYDSSIISKEELQDSSGRLIIIYGFSSNNVE